MHGQFLSGPTDASAPLAPGGAWSGDAGIGSEGRACVKGEDSLEDGDTIYLDDRSTDQWLMAPCDTMG